MTRFAVPIAEQIWDMKYRMKDAEGRAIRPRRTSDDRDIRMTHNDSHGPRPAGQI